MAALLTPEGAEALAAAMAVAELDPLAATSRLRARAISPDLAATALTQAVLRRRAAAKFGADAEAMLFTRAGLEQATRAEVATRRAARLAASGARTVADLGCGIGTDAIAFARAGLRVLAVDADPLTAAVAAANVAALGLGDRVSVTAIDAREVSLSGMDAVFCDPARRTAAGRRVFDPNAYSPPWDFIVGLTERVPRTALKLAPGIDHALIPPGAEAQWVSVHGDLVEAAFWCGPLAEVPRRATLLRDGETHELTGTGEEQAPVGPLRRYLYDPDSAVVRAHLVAEFALTVNGTLADPTIAYVYADAPLPTPYGRCLEIVDSMPFSLKRLRSALHARGAGRITIAKRGSAVDVERLRRDLRPTGDAELTVVLTRVAGAPTALLCTPV
nr:class I SAM-dependent methyltransferase [Planosporangium flavigriseum]